MTKLDIDLNLDAIEIEPAEYALLPDGIYNLVIEKVGVSKTKAGTGTKIDLSFREPKSNKLIFSTLNIENPNEMAERIGRKQLKELLIALGVSSEDFANHIETITGMRISGSVKTKKGEGQFKDRNEIARFKSHPDGPGARNTFPEAVLDDDTIPF